MKAQKNYSKGFEAEAQRRFGILGARLCLPVTSHLLNTANYSLCVINHFHSYQPNRYVTLKSYYKIKDMYSHLRWQKEERTSFAFGPVLQSGWRLARPLRQITHAQLGLVKKY
jgi:hypothetical protein